MRQQPSHQKGRRDTTLARAPTGEATRPSSHQKQESECGHLTQDVSLEAWDLTHGPSTDLSVVDIKSPAASRTLGQRDPEEE